MNKHLARVAAPKSWPIIRKSTHFTFRTIPGPYKLEQSMPLGLIIRDMLNYANTNREIKKILNEGKILVNHIKRKEPKFPVGIMDIIEIPSIKELFILLYNQKGKFILKKISKEDSSLRPYKITNKTILKKKKIQLTLNNGYNLIIDKDLYKIGDSILISNNEIKKHLKLEKGSLLYLTGGKHIGKIATLEGVHKFLGSQPNKIIFKIGKDTFETLREHAFVIDKSFEKCIQ